MRNSLLIVVILAGLSSLDLHGTVAALESRAGALGTTLRTTLSADYIWPALARMK